MQAGTDWRTLHVFNVFDRLDLYQFIYKCSTAAAGGASRCYSVVDVDEQEGATAMF